MAINANVYKFLSGAKNTLFRQGNALSPFTIGAAYIGGNKLLRGTSKIVRDRGQCLGRGLWTDKGDNVMASGRRGIDSTIGNNSGLVQGLHSNRRKY